MNKKQPIIVGLDIGTTKVVAIAGRKNEYGKIEILGYGRADSAGVNHGVVINIEQCIRSIEQALEVCLANNPQLEIRDVYVGIAGQHIKSLQSRGVRVRANGKDTAISREDIDGMVRDQYETDIAPGDKIIKIVPQDFTVDNIPNIVDPIGMCGVKLAANFHIITGDSAAIKNIHRCVERTNLKINDLVLQPLASAAAVLSDEDLEMGVAIVDIGGGTTDMAVFYDGILKHTAVIPYAGENITRDIRIGLGVLKSQAEEIKVKHGVAFATEASNNNYLTIPGLRGLPAKEVSIINLANIIQARMEEILDYVVYNLKQLNLENQLNGGIILTGGGAKLTHLIQLTEYFTGMKARIGYPNEHLAGGYDAELMSPMYATCIGLILRGYDDFEQGATAGNNYIHLSTEPAKSEIETPLPTVEPEPPDNVKPIDWGIKRYDELKKILRDFKGKFIGLFEDDEDRML